MPKFSDQTALTGANLAAGDLHEVVDISDTSMAASGTNKKMTTTEQVKGLRRLGRKACIVSRSTVQTITNNSVTAMSWDTAVVNDDTMWAIGTPTDIVLSTTGLWLIGTTVAFKQNAAPTTGYCAADFYNITDAAFIYEIPGSFAGLINTSSGSPTMGGMVPYMGTAGKHIQTRVYQSSGINRDVWDGEFMCAILLAET